MKFSVVVPVFKNEASIPALLEALSNLNGRLNNEMEAVFVIDGSPDRSVELLRDALPGLDFYAQVLAHSRNFGSFPAIRTGLAAANGYFIGVMAADLQEPPDLMIEFFRSLDLDECDVVIGTRTRRDDPWLTKLASNIFWRLYRRLVIPEIPQGGVDVFGCNHSFRDHLLKLEETHSSLIALIFWLGFRRKYVSYERQARLHGTSSWTISKKVEYMMDSVFAFSNYPIRALLFLGVAGSMLGFFLGSLVFIGHLSGTIVVPGYATTMIVVLFFGMLNLLGLGLVGAYTWRGYENSKKRPLAMVCLAMSNTKKRQIHDS
jgi:glycosyltransferase involved in cell wall biosynthesis